jgi:WD40 repeat protein
MTGEKLYGRDTELRQLLDLLIAERIVLLHSPSGAGKSSLIYAGLIPQLREEGFNVLPTIRVNLEPPVETSPAPASAETGGAPAAESFNRYIYSALLSLDSALPEAQQTAPEILAQMTLSAYLDQYVASLEASDSTSDQARNMVLIFDQFEEILTIAPNDRESKAAFFAQVGAALRDRGRWALFSMREDYMAALEPYLRPVPTRLANRFRLDLLGPEAAQMAIQRPCAEIGVDFAGAAAAKLVNDLRRVQVQRPDGTIELQPGPYVEPVQLQVVCYRLFEKLPAEAAGITEDNLAAIGDVDASLAEYYGARVAAAAQETGVNERQIRSWFEHHLITEQGIRNQVLMGSGSSEGLDNQAINLLVNAHLVRSEKRAGTTWFELAHDRLIQPVRSDNNHWFQEKLNLFQRQAELWERSNRPDGLVLRQRALEEAESWAINHPKELTAAERDFLSACQKARQRSQDVMARAEQALKLAMAQDEAENEKRRAQAEKMRAEAESQRAQAEEQRAESEKLRAELQAQATIQLRRRSRLIIAALSVASALALAAAYFGIQAGINGQRAQQNLQAAQTAQANADEQRQLADLASTQAIAQEGLAKAASTQAIAQRGTAVVASTLAIAQQGTAVAASTLAVAQQGTAEAASTQAIAQQGTAEAERSIAAVAQVEAMAQRDVAQRQSKLARSSSLAALAQNMLLSQPELSLLLSVEAYQAADTWQARSALFGGLVQSLQSATKPYGRDFPVQNVSILHTVFSPDGQKLAWAGTGGALGLWHVTQQRMLWASDTGRPDSISGLAFSTNGQVIITSDEGGRLNFWETATGRLTGQPSEIVTELKAIYTQAISPDGSTLAVAGAGGYIYFFDIPSRSFIPNLILRGRAETHCLVWSQDGKQLAAGSLDRLIHIWDVQSRAETSTLSGAQGAILALAWAPDGQTLISGGRDDSRDEQNTTLMVWNIRSGKGSPLNGHTDRVTSIALSPDGKTMVTGSYDQTINLWDATRYRIIERIAEHKKWVTATAFSPQGTLLLASASEDRTIRIYELVTLNPLGLNVVEKTGPVAGLAFNAADKTLLVAGLQSSSIKLSTVDVVSQTITTASTLSAKASATAISADGKYLALGGLDGVVRILLTSTRAEQQSVYTLDGQIVSLAFSPDSRWLAAGVCGEASTGLNLCRENRIVLWDLSSGQVSGTFPKNNQNATQAEIPPAHNDYILSLAFSADGKYLASGSQDTTILLWEVSTYEQVGAAFTGHSGSVVGLAFTPNGSMLVSSGADRRLIFWDVATRQPLGTPVEVTAGALTSLLVTPDGQSLYSGSSDGYIAIWDIDINSWLGRACTRAGRNLTQAEWEQYFPNEPYRITCTQYQPGP